MAFTPKDWKNSPDASTPVTAEALEDMEIRLSDYADISGGGGGGTTQKSTAVDGGSAIIVGTTSIQIASTNSSVAWREYTVDHPTGKVYLKLGGAATVNSGKVLLPSGPGWGTNFQGTIFAIASEAGVRLLRVEI